MILDLFWWENVGKLLPMAFSFYVELLTFFVFDCVKKQCKMNFCFFKKNVPIPLLDFAI